MGPPLIDLHAHLEGSLSRSTLGALAARHRLRAPSLRFDGFGGFLKAFGAVCDLLVDEEDFHAAALDLLDRSRRLGIVHIEVLFSPQVFLRRGVPAAAIMGGLLRARREAMTGGFSVVYIADGVRQWGAEWFEQTVGALEPWAGRGLAAIGVGGDEASLPATDYVRAYRRARDLGLRATMHAGEAAGPESVREALAALRLDRVGHGIRASEDADLLEELAARGVTLEVCPTSNIVTGVVGSWKSHPLPLLLEHGVRVTINSDDGAFFDTDVSRELRRVSREYALTREDLLGMTLNAARASFLDPGGRRALERRIRRGWSRWRRFREGRPRRAGRSVIGAGGTSWVRSSRT